MPNKILSNYQLYLIHSIDPNLDSNWKNKLENIFINIDSETRNKISDKVLKKRNINADLSYIPNKSLNELCKTLEIENPNIKKILIDMKSLIADNSNEVEAFDFIDRIEAIIYYIKNLNLSNDINELIKIQAIKNSFLYDIAKKLDDINIKLNPGFRKLNQKCLKSYIKEVYIKSEIQMKDFRYWSSTDIDFNEYNFIPDIIRKQSDKKKFHVVEGDIFWFIVGEVDKLGQNPFSIRRFLYEDISEGQDKKFVYLTHVILSKKYMNTPEHQKYFNICMNRLYTLDLGVSDKIRDFVNDSFNYNKKYLSPMLNNPINTDGSNYEYVIRKRLINFEQQLTTLIIGKLSSIIDIAFNDINDFNFLLINYDKLLRNLISQIEDFKLFPYANYSLYVDELLIKVVTYRDFISKFNSAISLESYDNDFLHKGSSIVIDEIVGNLNSTEKKLEEIDKLKDEIDAYNEILENGNFWQKLKLRKHKLYSIEEVSKMYNEAMNNLFINLIRIFKKHTDYTIYYEFEHNQTFSDEYRHYSIPNGNLGINRLPIVISLPEDKTKFNLIELRDNIEYDVFNTKKLV